MRYLGEQCSNFLKPCPYVATVHQEIQNPESLAFVPPADVQKEIWIVEQSPLCILGEPRPSHITTDLAGLIPKEMDLLVLNDRLDSQSHARDRILTVLIRPFHRIDRHARHGIMAHPSSGRYSGPPLSTPLGGHPDIRVVNYPPAPALPGSPARAPRAISNFLIATRFGFVLFAT